MQKPNMSYFRAAEEALRNSKQWLNEANCLSFEKKSYGHSCALSIFSLEESMKAMICFFIGVGIMKPEHGLADEVFRLHSSKVEIAAFLSMLPELQKAAYGELDEKQQKEFADFFVHIEPRFTTIVSTLGDFRMKGMYVDLIEGAISSPMNFSSDQAEGVFIAAFLYYKAVEAAIRRYENASEEERSQMFKESENYARTLKKNLQKILEKS